MKEQFTPGPWRAERRNVVELQYSIVNAQGEWVANVSADDSPDARLIAEAPAMFALLQKWMGGIYCDCQECQATRALIARVLGPEVAG